MPSTYYELLSIEKDASIEEIRRAYKKAALQTHPDKNPENRESAEEQFKKLAAAFEVLNDPKKRVEYDRYLRSGEGSDYDWEDPIVDMPHAEEVLQFANRVLSAYLKEQKRKIELGVILAEAAHERNWTRVEELVQEGASLSENSNHVNYDTALHIAIKDNDFDRISWLLSKGASTNVRNGDDNTPLHLAIELEDKGFELCSLLIQNGALLHHQRRHNWDTPLHVALKRNNPKIALLLARNGTQSGWLMFKKNSHDVQDTNGDTPLHLALRLGHYTVAEELLSTGAKINVRNKYNEVPLDFMSDEKMPLSTKKIIASVAQSQISSKQDSGSCNLM